MSWCKVSSLTAAVAMSLRRASFPATREEILESAGMETVEGWGVSYFLRASLSGERYESLRSVISELECWLEVQG